MRFARLLTTASLAALFFAGCWGDPIAYRTANDNDHIPYASKGKAEKALLQKLGKAPANAAPAEGAAPRAAEGGQPPAEDVPAGE